jgi:hypothetical protein
MVKSGSSPGKIRKATAWIYEETSGFTISELKKFFQNQPLEFIGRLQFNRYFCCGLHDARFLLLNHQPATRNTQPFSARIQAKDKPKNKNPHYGGF